MIGWSRAGQGHAARPRVDVLLVVAAMAVSAAACSSEAEQPRVGVNGTIAPLTTGGSCTDPRSDVSTDAARAGSRAEPAGVDLLKVDAVVTPTALKVTYEMAGPIAPTPTPSFVLAQGPSTATVSFEVRAAPGADPTAPWELTLVTWRVNSSGTHEVRDTMTETATVNGSTLAYDIPLKSLPPIATLIWIFGAQSGDERGPFDDCSSYDSTNGTLPPDTAPAATTSTTAPPEVKIGEPQTHKGGDVITVFEVQDPPKKEKKLDTPVDADRRLVLVNVEYCASPARPGSARARQFGVTLVTNEIIPIWDQVQKTVDSNYPDFPLSEPLDAGKCRRNWVSFSLPKDVAIAEIFYSVNPVGDDAVVWKLAPTQGPPVSSSIPPSVAPTTLSTAPPSSR